MQQIFLLKPKPCLTVHIFMDSTDVLFSLGGVRELPASHYTGEADEIFLHPKHTDGTRTWPIHILCVLMSQGISRRILSANLGFLLPLPLLFTWQIYAPRQK